MQLFVSLFIAFNNNELCKGTGLSGLIFRKICSVECILDFVQYLKRPFPSVELTVLLKILGMSSSTPISRTDARASRLEPDLYQRRSTLILISKVIDIVSQSRPSHVIQ